MPRSGGGRLSPPAAARLTALATALTLASCQVDDPGTAGCQSRQQVALAGSPLALQSRARLDRVGAGLALSGVEPTGADTATVRWASVDVTAGQLGPEHVFVSQGAGAGPWLAPVKTPDGGDALLMARARPAPNGRDAELTIVTLLANGAVPASPSPLAVIPGGFASGAVPVVAFAPSRPGTGALLAWLAPGSSPAVNLVAVSGTGQASGAPAVLEASPALDCLAFAPGRSDQTLVYFKYETPTSRIPTMVITELTEAGAVDSTLGLTFQAHQAGCPQLTPTAGGYAVAFQDRAGSWLAVYTAATNRLDLNAFAGAAAFGGPDLQPPLVGLAPVGADFGVVFARLQSAELWRVGPRGTRRPGALIFPSAQGVMGGVSTVPLSDGLYVTYADYTAQDGTGRGTAGQRYLVTASCL